MISKTWEVKCEKSVPLSYAFSQHFQLNAHFIFILMIETIIAMHVYYAISPLRILTFLVVYVILLFMIFKLYTRRLFDSVVFVRSTVHEICL